MTPDHHNPFSMAAGESIIPKIPPLASAEIHVLRISLLAPPMEIANAMQILTEEERGRAATFRFLPDQRRFVLRRARLRQLLATYLATHPLELRLESGPQGKPFLAQPAGTDEIHFSCSHSGDLALIAVARGVELGVDLQQHQPMNEAEDLARRYFSASEIRELAQLPPALKIAGFYHCWTRKEAFIKAIGRGLSYPLNRFSVSLTPGQPAAILSAEDEPEAVSAWTMVSLEVAPDYSAALVFKDKLSQVRSFAWDASPQA